MIQTNTVTLQPISGIMRKFLIRALGFTALILLILAIIVIFYVWHSRYSHVYLDEYGHKEMLLANTTSPRIIFMGGSNIAFGIDSKAVEDSVRMKPINAALQLGLGMRIMLSEVSNYSRKGDILVLSPEYENLYGCAYGSNESLSTLALLYPKITKYLNPTQMLVVIKGMPDAFIAMNNLFLWRIMNTKSNNYSYTSLSFNAYGDEERHWTFPKDNVKISDNHIPDTFDEEYFEEFCSVLDDLEARGIDVILTPPSVYSKFYNIEKEKINYVEERLQKAGHPFAYGQELSVYEKNDIFDSSYHLTKTGIDKRMPLIIDVLRSHIRSNDQLKLSTAVVQDEAPGELLHAH